MTNRKPFGNEYQNWEKLKKLAGKGDLSKSQGDEETDSLIKELEHPKDRMKILSVVYVDSDDRWVVVKGEWKEGEKRDVRLFLRWFTKKNGTPAVGSTPIWVILPPGLFSKVETSKDE